VIRRRGLTMIMLSTKFKVCFSTGYEDMKGDANAEIGVVLVVRGSLVAQDNWK